MKRIDVMNGLMGRYYVGEPGDWYGSEYTKITRIDAQWGDSVSIYGSCFRVPNDISRLSRSHSDNKLVAMCGVNDIDIIPGDGSKINRWQEVSRKEFDKALDEYVESVKEFFT